MSLAKTIVATTDDLITKYEVEPETITQWVDAGRLKVTGSAVDSIAPDLRKELIVYYCRAHENELDSLPESWRETYKRAIDKKRMEADTQRIIEQAQAEIPPADVAHVAEHPAPDTRAELGIIALEAAHLDDVVAELRERDIPLTAVEVEAVLGGLRAITQHSTRTAWQLGLHAVQQGLISQAKLAELVGASTASVSRRFHDGLTETEAHRIARTDVRTTPLK